MLFFSQQSNKCKNLNMCEEIQLNRILTPILLHWTTAIGRSMTVFAHLMLCHWQLLGDKCKWATNSEVIKSWRITCWICSSLYYNFESRNVHLINLLQEPEDSLQLDRPHKGANLEQLFSSTDKSFIPTWNSNNDCILLHTSGQFGISCKWCKIGRPSLMVLKQTQGTYSRLYHKKFEILYYETSVVRWPQSKIKRMNWVIQHCSDSILLLILMSSVMNTWSVVKFHAYMKIDNKLDSWSLPQLSWTI